MTRMINNSRVHIRLLTLYTDKPFRGTGSDLRRAITAQFKDIPVLHNHNGVGFDYRSPRVRYLVVDRIPRLLSFEDGLDIAERIYQEKPSLKVGYVLYDVTGTELEDRIEDVGIFGNDGYRYVSLTPWLALNEDNYAAFSKMISFQAKRDFLSKILVGNLLSLSKSLNLEIRAPITLKLNSSHEIGLKAGQVPMLGFKIDYETNYKLPSLVGIGKLTSKGFGIMGLQT